MSQVEKEKSDNEKKRNITKRMKKTKKKGKTRIMRKKENKEKSGN